MAGNLRQSINEKPGVIVGAAVVLMAAAIGFAYYTMRTPRAQPINWTFVDEETGEESTHSAADVPPLIGKGGRPSVVRAVYSCIDCPTKKLWYYEKYSDEAKAAMQKMAESRGQVGPEMANVFMQVERGHLIRLPQAGSPWVPIQSREGQQLIMSVMGVPGAQGPPAK